MSWLFGQKYSISVLPISFRKLSAKYNVWTISEDHSKWFSVLPEVDFSFSYCLFSSLWCLYCSCLGAYLKQKFTSFRFVISNCGRTYIFWLSSIWKYCWYFNGFTLPMNPFSHPLYKQMLPNYMMNEQAPGQQRISIWEQYIIKKQKDGNKALKKLALNRK